MLEQLFEDEMMKGEIKQSEEGLSEWMNEWNKRYLFNGQK